MLRRKRAGLGFCVHHFIAFVLGIVLAVSQKSQTQTLESSVSFHIRSTSVLDLSQHIVEHTVLHGWILRSVSTREFNYSLVRSESLCSSLARSCVVPLDEIFRGTCKAEQVVFEMGLREAANEIQNYVHAIIERKCSQFSVDFRSVCCDARK